MKKKNNALSCVCDLINYIHVNEDCGKIEGANLEYVLIVLNKLKGELEDADI